MAERHPNNLLPGKLDFFLTKTEASKSDALGSKRQGERSRKQPVFLPCSGQEGTACALLAQMLPGTISHLLFLLAKSLLITLQACRPSGATHCGCLISEHCPPSPGRKVFSEPKATATAQRHGSGFTGTKVPGSLPASIFSRKDQARGDGKDLCLRP